MSTTIVATHDVAKVTHKPIRKKAMSAPKALNEAYKYQRPSSFSRGMRLDIKGITILMISGTASVGESGETVHRGDFGAQTRRAYQNVTELLKSEGATWKDVVRTTCYLRDIERDYEQFNLIRTEFFKEQGLEILPASTGIQAILCWPTLLYEMEAMAIFETSAATDPQNLS
jgi:2-iminobutanoate/2-iminopropanoate deaminase